MKKETNYIFHHTTPVQLRFNDFDSLEHVNNSVYQNYYDLARTSYIEHVFEQKMQWHERGLVLVKITLEYIRPILMDEKVEVKTKIFKLGNKSLGMAQQIINSETGELKSESESVMVAFIGSADKPCPMPEDWRQKIIRFESDIEFN